MNKLILALCIAISLTACSFFVGEPSRVENPIIRGIHYVGLTVSDLDQASKLLSDSFDLAAVENEAINNSTVIDTLAGRSGVSINSRLMRSVNGQLRLMQFADPSEAAGQTLRTEVYGPGFSHACFQVNHETQAYQNFLAGGGTHVGSEDMVQLNPRNPVYYAYARNQDETMFEIEHVDVAKLDLPEPPKNKYRFRHIALASPDIDRLVKFYSVLLEYENPRRLGRLFAMSGEKFDDVSGLSDAALKMAFFDVRNMELEIAQITSHPTDSPTSPRPLDALGYNMIVFDVTDLAAAKEKLLAAGGSVITEPTAMDGGQIFFGRDIDSNLLGFQVLEAGSPLSAQNFADNGI
ncbi:MAG: VOC family protein [Pseudomonadota bacterium]